MMRLLFEVPGKGCKYFWIHTGDCSVGKDDYIAKVATGGF